jgi:hypothetical protein
MSKLLITRSEDYSKWYELVVKADLAKIQVLRACMVIKLMATQYGKNAS